MIKMFEGHHQVKVLEVVEGGLDASDMLRVYLNAFPMKR